MDPDLNAIGGLTKSLLKLGHKWVIAENDIWSETEMRPQSKLIFACHNYCRIAFCGCIVNPSNVILLATSIQDKMGDIL